MRGSRSQARSKSAGLSGKDVLLLTDGRFVGTTGLCVGHIAPEVDGGPIALLRNGGRIRLGVAGRVLDNV